VTLHLRNFGGRGFEQNLAAKTYGAVREIPVIGAGPRGKSVNERTPLCVEIVPRLLQMLEAEPIQQPEHTLAQRQAVQTLADGVRNFLPLLSVPVAAC
jgi:hypothetical protein